MEDKFQKPEEKKEVKVFVYGTLMKGNSDHEKFLSDAKFLGDFKAEGFQIYDFGNYPLIIHNEIEKIKGEIYIIDSNILSKLDKLEGIGNLYIRKLISVVNDNDEVEEAYIYVYNKDFSRKIIPSNENQPKGEVVRNDYVWYASYGSNLLYERFITYIMGGECKFNGVNYAGCRNKSLPKDSRPITIPYKMYYGSKSSSWGNAGVSFLDMENTTQALGRMYLVTKEQFEDISRQEGTGENWYNQSISLGEQNGIEIFTFTNKIRREYNNPSNKYLAIVKMGLKETYPDMSDFDVMKYLVECGLE